jgi:uncharacterized membrane protein YhhN
MMSRLSLWLSILVIGLAAAMAIYGKQKKQKFVHCAFKPLTMVLIISLAWERTVQNPSIYGYFILAGLCVSLLGDIFLMLPGNRIRPGLLAFMGAQILYILAFSRGIQSVHLKPLAVILAYGAVFFLFLYRGLGRMRWPVLAYILVISAMVWLAFNRYMTWRNPSSLLVSAGAALFLLSDSLNGVKRFRKTFPLAEILVLGTYFPAQLLFALSI